MIIWKNKLNHQLNIVIQKKIAYHDIFCKMFFFCFTNLSKSYFFIAGSFLYWLKILILPAILLKWNKTCCIEYFLVNCPCIDYFPKFCYFCQSIKFPQSWIICFINDDSEVTKDYTKFLSTVIINKLIRGTTNTQLCNFRLKEGLKPVEYQSHKFTVNCGRLCFDPLL